MINKNRKMNNLFNSNTIIINEATLNDLKELWEVVSEYGKFMSYFLPSNIQSYNEFCDMWKERVVDTVIGRHSESNIFLGCGYLHQLIPGHYGTINIIKKRRYQSPDIIPAIWAGIKYFFEKYDLVKIVATIREGNIPSSNLAKQLGFTLDGILRHHMFIDGQWRDFQLYTILREDL